MREQEDNRSGTASRARRFYRQFWFRGVLYLAAAYVAWCIALYFYQDRLVFPAELAPPPLPAGAGGEAVRMGLDLETGGQVEAWFVPAPRAGAQQPVPAVVFCHGNAELIDHQDDIVRGYHRLGCSVLLPEYRGYGRCGGTPSQRAILADTVRFYDELVRRQDVDRTRIVFHGRSLGGGVAADLATQRRPAALILESTFASVASMAHGYGVPTFLAKHPFRTDRAIAGSDVPVLIFHGLADTIIPVAHGRRLHELRPDAVYVEYDCGHNDFPGRGNQEAYWRRIAEFLSGRGILRAAPGDRPTARNGTVPGP